ncbi:MAG: capsular polysaccharide synthesis protein [Bacteroidales bacterium]
MASMSFYHKFRPIYTKVVKWAFDFKYFCLSLVPYKYNKERYKNTFIEKITYEGSVDLTNIDRVIYCFWTGENDLTPNRKLCLESIIRNCGVRVELITPSNLDKYILPQYPLHPSYKYLSLIHRSDYLRCYFMHHYGGGYVDIKYISKSWINAFNQLELSDKYILGYREVSWEGIGEKVGMIGSDLCIYWKNVIGTNAYICRPYTHFTYDWYSELNRRMDIYAHKLAKYPGNTFGSNDGYPIPWANILGAIFHPLCLKYHNKLMQVDEIKPSFKNYR